MIPTRTESISMDLGRRGISQDQNTSETSWDRYIVSKGNYLGSWAVGGEVPLVLLRPSIRLFSRTVWVYF